jgi:hypothetical protein
MKGPSDGEAEYQQNQEGQRTALGAAVGFDNWRSVLDNPGGACAIAAVRDVGCRGGCMK